jgi:NAD(P)-dependent dehydrogenase (short-subunit alcohol dehydrogenase family)
MWRDKTAVVTGAGSGIGRALALAMSARGTHVLVSDIDGQAAERVAAECGSSATALALDVRDAQAVREAIEGFAQKHGRLDYLFNNAGIGVGGEVQDFSLGHWDRIIDINIRGVIHGIAVAYPMMIAQGFGHIINTASLAGLGPAPMLAPYAMTKHAVVGLSTSLRAEAVAYGVKVSALCPAAIETPILDSENPTDLPDVPSRPNIRNLLTRLAGKPYPVDKMAAETLAAIEKNQGVIVLPGKARAIWRIGRMAPPIVDKACVDAVAIERRDRNGGT